VSIELHDLRLAVITSQYHSLRQAAEAIGIRQSTLAAVCAINGVAGPEIAAPTEVWAMNFHAEHPVGRPPVLASSHRRRLVRCGGEHCGGQAQATTGALLT
jgi:hypothetical protein